MSKNYDWTPPNQEFPARVFLSNLPDRIDYKTLKAQLRPFHSKLLTLTIDFLKDPNDIKTSLNAAILDIRKLGAGEGGSLRGQARSMVDIDISQFVSDLNGLDVTGLENETRVLTALHDPFNQNCTQYCLGLGWEAKFKGNLGFLRIRRVGSSWEDDREAERNRPAKRQFVPERTAPNGKAGFWKNEIKFQVLTIDKIRVTSNLT